VLIVVSGSLLALSGVTHWAAIIWASISSTIA
jgi:hypothetical protein